MLQQSPVISTPPKIVGMIPARLGSTRFPEKVLASATGKPLVQHVYERASRATSLNTLVIATDHPRVATACNAFGATVLMTREDHPNGSSRLAEAADQLRLADTDIVVNIQGDEPEIEPAVIDAAARAVERTNAEVATIATPFAATDDPANPAIVKVITRADGMALYFSRSRIPYPRDAALAQQHGVLRHVGLYAYRVGFLRTYVTLPATPLERIESLEQLRVLEHGYRIAVVTMQNVGGAGIDTPEQYEAFVHRIKSL